MIPRNHCAVYPEIYKQWHPTKNSQPLSDDILFETHRKVWWRCEKGHEWEAQVRARLGGSGCPYCSNRKITVGENDLATTHPDLTVQWHPSKNAPLTPQMVVAGSHRKIWWKGTCGHEWQASLLSRTANQSGCPVCAGKLVLPGENDLESQFPQIAAQWHPDKNGNMKASDVTAYSNRRAWWRCELGHEYQAVIAQRVRSASDCPYCTGRRVLVGFNDLSTTHPKSAAQWHPTLNGTLTPDMVTKGSHQKVWWQCSEGHVWKTAVYTRTGAQQCGCPVCAGKVKKIVYPLLA